MLSSLLVLLWTSRCRCAPKKISLVNEVQCGTGSEWRDLIGQQSVSSLALFLQDLLLHLPFWLAPLLPFNFLACAMSVLHSEVS